MWVSEAQTLKRRVLNHNCSVSIHHLIPNCPVSRPPRFTSYVSAYLKQRTTTAPMQPLPPPFFPTTRQIKRLLPSNRLKSRYKEGREYGSDTTDSISVIHELAHTIASVNTLYSRQLGSLTTLQALVDWSQGQRKAVRQLLEWEQLGSCQLYKFSRYSLNAATEKGTIVFKQSDATIDGDMAKDWINRLVKFIETTIPCLY